MPISLDADLLGVVQTASRHKTSSGAEMRTQRTQLTQEGVTLLSTRQAEDGGREESRRKGWCMRIPGEKRSSYPDDVGTRAGVFAESIREHTGAEGRHQQRAVRDGGQAKRRQHFSARACRLVSHPTMRA